MKPPLCFVAVVMLFGLAPRPGEALRWEVFSYVFATEKPNGLNTSYVWSRGYHQLAVTHIRTIDTIIPFRARISTGEVKFEGAPMDACSTSWRWSFDEAFFHECKTYAIQPVCEDGAWSSAVTGRLDFHPNGGYRFATSAPKLMNCACT